MYDYKAYYIGAKEVINFDNLKDIHLISYFIIYLYLL